MNGHFRGVDITAYDLQMRCEPMVLTLAEIFIVLLIHSQSHLQEVDIVWELHPQVNQGQQ